MPHNTEFVDLVDSNFFLQYGVVDSLPTFKYDAMFDTKIDHRN